MLYFVSEAWGLSSCCPVSPPGLGSAVVPWMGLSSAPFSTDASWHSGCVILIVAVQLASNISLESAIDQGNPKSKLLRLAVPVELTNCPKTVCSCGETRMLGLSMDWTELPPSSKGDCEYNSIMLI